MKIRSITKNPRLRSVQRSQLSPAARLDSEPVCAAGPAAAAVGDHPAPFGSRPSATRRQDMPSIVGRETPEFTNDMGFMMRINGDTNDR